MQVKMSLFKRFKNTINTHASDMSQEQMSTLTSAFTLEEGKVLLTLNSKRKSLE